MGPLRRFMQNNPMLGWIVASVLVLGTAGMLIFRLTAKNETQQLTQLITIRDAETGDTWTVVRGAMEKELWLRPYPVDPNEGLPNPKTGKRTGFPIDAWKETVQGINAERAEDSKPAPHAPSAPSAPRAPAKP